APMHLIAGALAVVGGRLPRQLGGGSGQRGRELVRCGRGGGVGAADGDRCGGGRFAGVAGCVERDHLVEVLPRFQLGVVVVRGRHLGDQRVGIRGEVGTGAPMHLIAGDLDVVGGRRPRQLGGGSGQRGREPVRRG